LAQKTLPILNRTGIYQHWDSFWDSNTNFTSTFKMHLLVERILIRFIENRNSLNHRLITKTFLNKYSYKFGFKTKGYSFLRISKILKKIKRRRKLYIYVGKVTFVKLQSWIIILLYLYRPRKKKIIKKGQRILFKKKKTFFIQQYLTDQLTSNGSFNYKKTVF